MHNSLAQIHLEQCVAPFGLEYSNLELIGVSQNHVYRVNRRAQRSILRVSVGRGRSLHEIEAELQWIRHLSEQGIKACAPLPSLNGNLMEEVVITDPPLGINEFPVQVVHFQHAPGREITPEDLTPRLFRAQGRLLGQLHQATRSYLAPAPHPRKRWDESRLLNTDLEQYVPAEKAEFRKAVRSLIDDLRQLPETPEHFGMIHADVYYQNQYLAQKGELWLYDFDNCEPGYFIQDLATCLYDCTLNRLTRAQREVDPKFGFAQAFWRHTLEGYREVADFPTEWLPYLRKCLALREAVIYIHYHRLYRRAQKPPEFWEAIEGMRQNVEAGRSSLPEIS